jgi:hypothetical protein
MKARLVMAVGLTVLVVIFAAVLLEKAPRRSGSNLTPNGAFVAVLDAGQQTCQEGELLPADTAGMRATIGTYGKPGPPLAVTLTGPHGEVLSSGGLARGWSGGVVQIPIRHVSTVNANARVCLRDGGPGPIALAGALPDPGLHMEVAGATVEGRLRYDYMRPGRESWLALLPTIVHRSTLAKAPALRHWAWAAAIVLMLLAVGLAARTIVREETV